MSELIDIDKAIQQCAAEMSKITSQYEWEKAVFRYKIKFEDDRDFFDAESMAAENILKPYIIGTWPSRYDPKKREFRIFLDWLKSYYKDGYCGESDENGFGYYCDCIICIPDKESCWVCESCNCWNDPVNGLLDVDEEGFFECEHCGESSNQTPDY